MVLLSKLDQALVGLGSLAWELDYDRSDLVEDVQNLRQLLRETIAGKSDFHDPHSRPRLLEDAMNVSLEERIADLELSLRMERSRNWELDYRCNDLAEEIGRLENQLRNTITVADSLRPPWQPRTAMERALEGRILDLQDQIRNPKGRGRSSSM